MITNSPLAICRSISFSVTRLSKVLSFASGLTSASLVSSVEKRPSLETVLFPAEDVDSRRGWLLLSSSRMSVYSPCFEVFLWVVFGLVLLACDGSSGEAGAPQLNECLLMEMADSMLWSVGVTATILV